MTPKIVAAATEVDGKGLRMEQLPIRRSGGTQT
jgi:hypothetical protein